MPAQVCCIAVHVWSLGRHTAGALPCSQACMAGDVLLDHLSHAFVAVGVAEFT